MYLYFDRYGNLKEFVNYPVRETSSNVNTIYVFVEPSVESTDVLDGVTRYLLPQQYTSASASFKLPEAIEDITDEDGYLLNPLVMSKVSVMIPYDEKRDLKYFQYYFYYQVWKVELTAASHVLDEDGNVECTVKLVDGNTSEVNPLQKFTFYVADSAVVKNIDISLSQYSYLLDLISSISQANYVSWIDGTAESIVITDLYARFGDKVFGCNNYLIQINFRSPSAPLPSSYTVSVLDINGTIMYQRFFVGPAVMGASLADVITDDYKVEFVRQTSNTQQIYATDSDGEQTTLNYDDTSLTADYIVQRSTDGQIYVPTTPVQNGHAVSKSYADSTFVHHRSQSGNNAYVNVGGTDTLMRISSNVEGGIASRDSNGNLNVADPINSSHATTKSYVDDNFVKQVDYPSSLVAYVRNHGTEGAMEITSTATASTIASRDGSGRIKAAAPSNEYDVANKYYVDTQITLAISTVYKYKGSKTVAQLNALTAQEIGDTYNVIDEGTLTDGNLHVLPGDNVVWDGEEWDKLAGTVDLTGYYTKVETDALLALKASISATVMDTDLIVNGGYITQISRNGEYIPVAQNVNVTTIPKVVQSTTDLPGTNDGYLYLVLDNGYLYHYVAGTGWTQAYQYTSDLLTITEVTVEED